MSRPILCIQESVLAQPNRVGNVELEIHNTDGLAHSYELTPAAARQLAVQLLEASYSAEDKAAP